MSNMDNSWLVAVAAIPLPLFVCTVFICIGIAYGIKQLRKPHPAISEVDTPSGVGQQGVESPVFTTTLQVDIFRDPPPPYDRQFVQPSNKAQNSQVAMGAPPALNSEVAMGTTPPTPPPSYQESVPTHSSILNI